ncbi:hypothetical protein [Pseudomonas sp. CCC2.2]|uniref:hypothetical protein n=1 Tax=Pseudomonas sp. CCC2.2 TaxID=3048605 RepID=UPI002B2273DC|nr:hypothetical protein [Pseudomonas sp. CCC2.2]MEB0149050.1 hypothetical protein [Pseudomonas sp. CCC2.2]
MTMYFVLNTSSNLITDAIDFTHTPTDSQLKKYILASDKSIAIYDKHRITNPEVLMDIGELMAKSAHVNDQVRKGRTGLAKPVIQRLRNELPERVLCRETQISEWIAAHPSADVHALNDKWCTGIVAALAYLMKHRL